MKYQYLCKTKDGELFITTEKCANAEDAKQYVGDGRVIRPIIEDVDALLDEAMEGIKEFVDRVEKGEIRSTYTYAKFKEILAKADS